MHLVVKQCHFGCGISIYWVKLEVNFPQKRKKGYEKLKLYNLNYSVTSVVEFCGRESTGPIINFSS